MLKTFAGRGQDWIDVEKTIVRQSGALDWNYIFAELRPLAELKGAARSVERLEQLRLELDR